MIQEFEVKNFLSFKDNQKLSFIANSDKTLLEELTVETKPGGIKLLRMALIYGANASGKSNLILAIQTVWKLLFLPKYRVYDEIEHFMPFELTKGKPSEFKMIFWANNRKYDYTLIYDKHLIHYEKMSYSSDSGVMVLMYERNFGEPILFGGTLGIKSKQKNDFNKDTLSNHTVISTLNKKNIDAPFILKELFEWLKSNINEIGLYNDGIRIAEQAENNPKIKSLILELLNKADFNISDFNLVGIPQTREFIEEIVSDPILSNETKERLIRPNKQILFTHKTDENVNFHINFQNQSTGTIAYFRLARLLFDLKMDGRILLEDELEIGLHYDLLIHYLQTYLQTNSKSQLVFTSHNQLLLNEEWMVRRDMIWFVEKENKTASSIVYRASDMGIHKNLSLMNAYKIGKLGAKPLLGATLINE